MDNPIAMINVSGTSQTWYYYYADALGSIRLLSDAGGAIVESYTYLAFGQPTVMTNAGTDGNWLTEDGTTINTSAVGNPYLFTARRWDFYTQLYYYRFRDYSPLIGRFLQPDPLGYIDGLNLYAYVNNNPLNWLDPWGLAKDDIVMVRKIGKALGLTDEGMNLLHDIIHNKGYNYHQILEEGKGVRDLGGKMVKGGGATKGGWARGAGGALTCLMWFFTMSQESQAPSIPIEQLKEMYPGIYDYLDGSAKEGDIWNPFDSPLHKKGWQAMQEYLKESLDSLNGTEECKKE
jgi:RHS repeat-associated protein